MKKFSLKKKFNSIKKYFQKKKFIKELLIKIFFGCLIVLIVYLGVYLFKPFGITEVKEIIFGQSAAFKGNSRSLGIDTRFGLLAAFNSINEQGGINGYKIKLISIDDGYIPKKTIRNTKKLVKNKKVFGLIGYMGTPTSKAIFDYIIDNKILYIGPYTGATFLRDPFIRNVVNIRLSYHHEVSAIVSYIKFKGFKKIAAFYQNDSFGLSILNPLKILLEENKIKLIITASYERNSLDIEEGLKKIKKKRKNIDAIVIAATSNAMAKFVMKAKKVLSKRVQYISPSPGGNKLPEKLGFNYKNVIVTQVVPNPNDKNLKIIRDYLKDLKKFEKYTKKKFLKPSFVSLEGYLSGRLTIEILKSIKGKLTKENFLKQLYSQGIYHFSKLRLGPYGDNCVPYSSGCPCNQGYRSIILTKINQDKNWETIKGFEFSSQCMVPEVNIITKEL